MQLDHRLGNGRELVRGGLHAVRVATGERRPGLGGRSNPFACLRQHGGIEAAKLRRDVVHRLGTGQAIGLAHRQQCRSRRPRGRHGLGAVEQQVLGQPVRHAGLAPRQRGVLGDNPGGGSLDIHVGQAKLVPHGLEESRAEFPEHPRLELSCIGRQTQADLRHDLCCCNVRRTNHLQHRLVHPGAHACVIGQRCLRLVDHWINPAPRLGPQFGRVNAVPAHKFHYLAVLRKQSHRGGRLALEYAFEVFGEGKTGTLHLVGGVVTAQLRTLDKLLRKCLHRTQHLGGRPQPDHLECTHGLVQLLARDAQLAGIHFSQIRATRLFRIAHEPAQRLGSTIQRLSQLVQHPGQRAEVIGDGFVCGRCRTVGLHLFVHSCNKPAQAGSAIGPFTLSHLEPGHRLAQLLRHPGQFTHLPGR